MTSFDEHDCSILFHFNTEREMRCLPGAKAQKLRVFYSLSFFGINTKSFVMPLKNCFKLPYVVRAKEPPFFAIQKKTLHL